ncbi:hypothetical protein BJ138DRAFT_902852 [Hygrophoropsis aurantiaca]|uniref:Uncharacterized protein n=1 Tax=Hygrophoropsis aurantiaca TaxID=72124 RepID=A0ACB8AEH9_9AGAM|nr:hypothetical protein BJ138DRAFT_902852 [Hygrophoropsis aurantiaca]
MVDINDMTCYTYLVCLLKGSICMSKGVLHIFIHRLIFESCTMFIKGALILILSAAVNFAIAEQPHCQLESQPSKVPHGVKYQVTVYEATGKAVMD